MSLWHAVKTLARRIGHIQGLIVLSMLYYVLIGPVALAVRLVTDPLRLLRRPDVGSYWGTRQYPSLSIDQAKSE